MTAPATPAPADGAPGERVSVDAKLYGTLLSAADSWAESHGDQYDGEAHATRLMFAAHRLRESAAPLPAPSASAGVGASDVPDAIVDLVGLLYQRAYAAGQCTDSGILDIKASATASDLLTAIADALSTAAAPVRPDREAVERALVEIAEAARDNYGEGDGDDKAIDRAMALVFGDSAPGEVDRGE